MSQFIAQLFQAGAVTECDAALQSIRYPSFTGKPEQNMTTKIHAKRDDARWGDIRREILEFFLRNALWLKVAQCNLVKCNAFW